ncbi:MAG: Rieske (2Fe-2S) protein [Pseudomonadota bacterium]
MPLHRRALLLGLGRATALGLAALAGRFGWAFFSEGHGPSPHQRHSLGLRADVLARVEASREGFWLDAEHRVLIVRDPFGDDPGLAAISLACTHLGCTLRPGPGNRRLECPCHGSAFAFLGDDGLGADIGRVLVGPATRDLDRLRVVRVGERLFLET